MRFGVVLRSALGRLRVFPKANRGNVAMIFGLALIPICLAAGAGLDMSRAMITRARLGNALDAAGLAIGSQPGMSLDQMKELANEYFEQNYTADPQSYGQPTEVSVVRPNGSQTITLSTSVAMPTVLMRIVGLDSMQVAATSQITWGQTKLWVALVLDNTGSMCEPYDPDNNCPSPNPGDKIAALKDATHNLLNMLQNAASNPGDVKVSIVPFSKDVNVGTASSTVTASWIDWTDWEAPPPNSTPANTVGPGSSCPYGTGKSPYGYTCLNMQSSKIATTGTYAGMICPGADNGRYNSGNGSTVDDNQGHQYNGCYDSVGTQTSTTTTTQSGTQTCTTVGSGSPSCSFSSDGSRPTTNTVVTNGYSGNSTTVTVTTSGSPSSPSCKTSGKGKSATTTCTTTQSASQATAVATGLYTHTWHANDHSTWAGCIMDRAQDYDVRDDAPTGSAKFPAENSSYCPPGTITPLGYDWTSLGSQVDAMVANGNTNQTVGLDWGWMTLTNSDPYNPGALPVDTRRVLILLTDGLNTQNRWSGSQSTIDTRTAAVCQNIKDDNITVYTVQVDTGGDPTSTVLQNCASDSSKFFMLTTADQIVSTFQQIGTQITNLRVSL